jgi:hypothetical protein
VTLTAQAGRASFVAKLNPQGVPQWVQQFGDVETYSLSIDGAANLFVSGMFYGSASFGDFTVVGAGQIDAFVAKLGTKRPRLALDPGAGGLNANGFQMTLFSEFGARLEVEGSVNLTDWLPLVNLTNSFGTLELTDPSATNLSRRFYRAVLKP